MAWRAKYGPQLQMLLFPTDEFAGAVEELPAEEIAGFLGDFKLTRDLPLDGDGVTLMEKVQVNGPTAHEVFEYGMEWFPGPVADNFGCCLLFDETGECVGYVRAVRFAFRHADDPPTKPACGQPTAKAVSYHVLLPVFNNLSISFQPSARRFHGIKEAEECAAALDELVVGV